MSSYADNTNAPTADDVYAESKLPWRRLGYPDATSIEHLILDAVGYVTWITGRYFSDFGYPQGIDGAEPIAAEPVLTRGLRRAVRMRAEQLAKQDQPGYIDTATDDLIASFSAGPYSESRRDPTRRGEQRILNMWPGLNDLLWQLMTEERFEYWRLILGMANAPAFSVEEVDWSLVGKSALFEASGAASMAPYPNLGTAWWS